MKHVKFGMVSRAKQLIAAVSAVVLITFSAFAQDSPVLKINAETERSDITVTPLRGGIFLLQGDGGNIGVLANEQTKFLVDAGISVSKEKLTTVINGISPGKVSHLVNTHWHWDHADGNPWIPGEGVTIVAHPNTARYLAQTERVDDWNFTFKPLDPKGIPKDLVSGSKTYKIAGESIEVTALPPSHTDGDLYVYFRQADVLFLGDVFWNGLYPFIDNEHGGSIDGMIKAVDAGLKVAGAETIIVPGHGPVARKADLVEFRRVLQSIRDSVAKLKAEGKDEKATVSAKPSAEYDAKWGNFVINPDLFVHLVYSGL
jgi:glyoxylase-like metal-dependent hydrolase (beta-lactamase superfamily II)